MKYAHGFVVLCFVVVMQSFIMNSHEAFIHIHQGCFAGTGAIVRLPQCQWSKPDGYGKISQYITTTKHSKANPCAYFLGYTVAQVRAWMNDCASHKILICAHLSISGVVAVDHFSAWYPVDILSVIMVVPRSHSFCIIAKCISHLSVLQAKWE